MKIILLGASGQLGCEWQYYLAPFHKQNIYLIPFASSQLDITRYNDVEHILVEQEADLIINCAAYTKVDKAEKECEKAQRVNTKAVKNLAELCVKHDVKLVHFSTDYIFSGQKEDQKHFPAGYPENHLADPVNWYGQTKWEGEQAIRASGCRHIIMRVSWLCGEHGNNFVKKMLRLSENRARLSVVDDQVGSPTFAHNLVQNTFKLIEEKRKGTYHLTSDGLISWADFAKSIFEIAGKQVTLQQVPSSKFPTEAPRPFFSKLNTQKIAQISGTETEHWKTGLEKLIKKL